jgi:hypothetical protein
MFLQYSRLILLEYCDVNYFGGASVPYALLRVYKMSIKKMGKCVHLACTRKELMRIRSVLASDTDAYST